MNEAILRRSLTDLLKGGQAHTGPDVVLAVVKAETRTRRPAEGLHSVWEELEHLRLAQEDILRYMTDPAWKSPDFPAGYWPAKTESVTEERWTQSVATFLSDLQEVIGLVNDPHLDLTARIPHGQEGHTWLRGVLLVADHNAYHLGQIVQTRKLLGDWPDS
ncbi:MAG TPA: DinB family protein [Blastocatellia bacterium]|nr:DinB family protein [Blastocatellia bacterium]